MLGLSNNLRNLKTLRSVSWTLSWNSRLKRKTLKSVLRIQRITNQSSMLSGSWFTKSYRRSLIPELISCFLSYLLGIWLLSISLTEMFSALEESKLKISRESKNQLELLSKQLLMVLLLMSSELAEILRKCKLVLRDSTSSRTAHNLRVLPLFSEEELSNSSLKLKDLWMMLLWSSEDAWKLARLSQVVVLSNLKFQDNWEFKLDRLKASYNLSSTPSLRLLKLFQELSQTTLD